MQSFLVQRISEVKKVPMSLLVHDSMSWVVPSYV